MDSVVVAAVVGAIALGSFLFGHPALRGWLASRPRGLQWALVAATALLVTGAAGAAGTASAASAASPPGPRQADASRGLVTPLVAADTFPHERHTKLACLECHETGTGHGRLTFEPPRGCAVCHHQAPTNEKCGSCHRTDTYGAAKGATVTITVPGRDPRPRTVEFLHSAHEKRVCLECHTTPVSLAPSPATAQCRDCHTDHHATGPTCATCHQVAEPKLEHKSLDVAHQRCDACHTPKTVALLTPTRALCSTCHAPTSKDHYDARECTVCHFLAEPTAYRTKLLTPSLR